MIVVLQPAHASIINAKISRKEARRPFEVCVCACVCAQLRTKTGLILVVVSGGSTVQVSQHVTP